MMAALTAGDDGNGNGDKEQGVELLKNNEDLEATSLPKKKASRKLSKVRAALGKMSCRSLGGMACLSLALVGYGTGTSLFPPILPDAAQEKGMDPSTTGILFGCCEMIMFIGALVWGKLAGFLGLRFMIGSGLLLCGGATMLFGLVGLSPHGYTYIALCFAVRIVEAIGASLYVTASYCMAGNIFPNNIAFAFSILETSQAVGRMIGPVAGGLLFEAAGFFLPFVTIGGVLILFDFLLISLLPMLAISTKTDKAPPSKDSVIAHKRPPSLSWSRLFRLSFKTWILAFSEAAAAIFSSYPQPTLALYLESLGLSDKAAIGGVFMGNAVGYAVSSVLVGHFVDKYPTRCYQVMAIGSVWTATCLVMMGPVPLLDSISIKPCIAITATAEILLECGVVLLIMPVPRGLMNIAKELGYADNQNSLLETSAMIAALFNSLWYFGTFIGPITAGFLAEAVGFRWAATIMATASLSLLPALMCSLKSHKKTVTVS